MEPIYTFFIYDPFMSIRTRIMNTHSKTFDQYVENKEIYNRIANTMVGSGSKNNNSKSEWKLFDDNDEKEKIMKAYQTVTESLDPSLTVPKYILSAKRFKDPKIAKAFKPCMSFSKKILETAVSGIDLQKTAEGSKVQLCSTIFDIWRENKNIPFIHEDSLSAWANQGVEKFGLTIRDIKNMKFGERMEIILMDRNSGENIPGEIGSKFMPTVHGFSIATYIHGDNLTGLLEFKNIGVVHAPFEWEINRAAVGDKYFWGPLDGCGSGCAQKKKSKKQAQFNPDDLDPNILVGWRGPSIRMSDGLKYLPKYAVKYDTWWDDYVVFKYTDFLHKK